MSPFQSWAIEEEKNPLLCFCIFQQKQERDLQSVCLCPSVHIKILGDSMGVGGMKLVAVGKGVRRK